jgi:hypothetical protein
MENYPIVFKPERTKRAGKFAQSNLVSHSSTCPSLVGGKILRYLIYSAQASRHHQDKYAQDFTLKLSELSRFLGQSPEVYLDALRGLLRSIIHWNQFAKYREPGWFKASPVLQYLAIPQDATEEELKENPTKRDYIVYRFSEHLHQALLDPQFFRVFDMALIQKFKSKYTLQLYDFCLSCLNDQDDFAHTPLLTERELRSLLGCEKTYLEIREFHREVLRPALVELNTLSEIEAELKFKRSRGVRRYGFFVKRKGKWLQEQQNIFELIQKERLRLRANPSVSPSFPVPRFLPKDELTKKVFQNLLKYPGFVPLPEGHKNHEKSMKFLEELRYWIQQEKPENPLEYKMWFTNSPCYLSVKDEKTYFLSSSEEQHIYVRANYRHLIRKIARQLGISRLSFLLISGQKTTTKA